MRATTEQKTKEKLSANDNECKGGSNWTRQMWNIIPYLAKEYQSPRYGALYILFGYKYSFDCNLHIAHGENGIVLISFYGFTPVSIAGNSWFSSNGTLASKQKINIWWNRVWEFHVFTRLLRSIAMISTCHRGRKVVNAVWSSMREYVLHITCTQGRRTALLLFEFHKSTNIDIVLNGIVNFPQSQQRAFDNDQKQNQTYELINIKMRSLFS